MTCLLALLLLASAPAPVEAVTVAHWNFESDLIAGSAVADQFVSHNAAAGLFEAAVADISGNNNHLSAWAGADMAYRASLAPNRNTGWS